MAEEWVQLTGRGLAAQGSCQCNVDDLLPRGSLTLFRTDGCAYLVVDVDHDGLTTSSEASSQSTLLTFVEDQLTGVREDETA